jgi:hypothetical protein
VVDLPRIAFKEWAAVVLALERGLQDVVFRRGGIAEERDAFEACHDAFLLWPTYHHQQRAGLDARHHRLFDEAVTSQPVDGLCRITSWARVLDLHILTSERQLDALEARHVYARDVLLERLHAPRGRAFYVLDVSVSLLDEPLWVRLGAEHAGCRSWIPVAPEA